MSKILYFLFFGLLIGCATTVSPINNNFEAPKAEIIEQDYDEMLELAKEMDHQRSPAIYVVVISEPETITAKPSKK